MHGASVGPRYNFDEHPKHRQPLITSSSRTQFHFLQAALPARQTVFCEAEEASGQIVGNPSRISSGLPVTRPML